MDSLKSTQLTASFSVKEMACPCCGVCHMDPRFMDRLQRVRDLLGSSLRIDSGYRCEKHNRLVGGEPGSMHLKGRAADIAVENGHERLQVILMGVSVGMRGIGIGRTYVHLDDRDGPSTMWHYYNRSGH